MHQNIDLTTGTVTVEGHADERGSAEYNLGLGDRRAIAAKDFLVQLGVPADRRPGRPAGCRAAGAQVLRQEGVLRQRPRELPHQGIDHRPTHGRRDVTRLIAPISLFNGLKREVAISSASPCA